MSSRYETVSVSIVFYTAERDFESRMLIVQTSGSVEPYIFRNQESHNISNVFPKQKDFKFLPGRQRRSCDLRQRSLHHAAIHVHICGCFQMENATKSDTFTKKSSQFTESLEKFWLDNHFKNCKQCFLNTLLISMC